MNQIIGKRLKHQINEDTQPNVGKLNAIGLEDLVLNSVKIKQKAAAGDDLAPAEKQDEDAIEEAKIKNFKNFLGKLGSYPKVHFVKFGKDTVDFDDADINDIVYAVTYSDKQILKMATGEVKDYDAISILLPINFTFTIHGISGIKRGDKFIVKGIPKKYEENGFFQVLGIKQSIQAMEWTTEIQGGYRTVKKADVKKEPA